MVQFTDFVKTLILLKKKNGKSYLHKYSKKSFLASRGRKPNHVGKKPTKEIIFNVHTPLKLEMATGKEFGLGWRSWGGDVSDEA